MPGSLKSLIAIAFILSIFNNKVFTQGRYGIELDNSLIITLKSRNRIVYKGIDNIIKVDASLKVKYDTVIYYCNNGILLSEEVNTLLIIPSRLGNVKVALYGILGSDTAIIGYTTFAVQAVPEPHLTINEKPITTNSTIPKEVLLQCDSIGVMYSKDIIGSEKWLKVVSFDLGYNYGGFYVSHDNHSNKLSKEIKRIIDQVSPGHEIGILPFVESEGGIVKRLPVYRISVY
jgi:hypothetical protein